jgi:hypothetical protein
MRWMPLWAHLFSCRNPKTKPFLAKRSQVTKWHTWAANYLSLKPIQILQYSKKLASFCSFTYMGVLPCPRSPRIVAAYRVRGPVAVSWPNSCAGVPPSFLRAIRVRFVSFVARCSRVRWRGTGRTAGLLGGRASRRAAPVGPHFPLFQRSTKPRQLYTITYLLSNPFSLVDTRLSRASRGSQSAAPITPELSGERLVLFTLSNVEGSGVEGPATIAPLLHFPPVLPAVPAVSKVYPDSYIGVEPSAVEPSQSNGLHAMNHTIRQASSKLRRGLRG